MMFFDEAVAELQAKLGDEPGWTSRVVSESGAIDWEQQESATRLRVLTDGTVILLNDCLWDHGAAYYDDALRESDSMGQWVEMAKALAGRDKPTLLRYFHPTALKV